MPLSTSTRYQVSVHYHSILRRILVFSTKEGMSEGLVKVNQANIDILLDG